MRIAQVSPLYESVPPRYYGGTERVVSYLTEELVKQGHDVTLFASGDSLTRANLIAPCPRALRFETTCVDPLAHHMTMVEMVCQHAHQFDAIHFHLDYVHLPLFRRSNHMFVTTLHGRLDIPDLIPLYRQFQDVPVVSISDAQREPLPFLNWLGTVYHGLPEHLYTFRKTPGEYLAFLGRISPEKQADHAIRIAKHIGIPLRIAAKVDHVDQRYFEEVIQPLLRDPLIDFIGEIGEKEKNEFLGNAKALLFPVNWPEPFGLVMIEALAWGTPVIAYRRGSVPEVLQDGVTGFIVNTFEEAVQAVERIETINRLQCRQIFETCFSATRMAQDYLSLYQTLLDQNLAAA